MVGCDVCAWVGGSSVEQPVHPLCFFRSYLTTIGVHVERRLPSRAFFLFTRSVP